VCQGRAVRTTKRAGGQKRKQGTPRQCAEEGFFLRGAKGGPENGADAREKGEKGKPRRGGGVAPAARRVFASRRVARDDGASEKRRPSRHSTARARKKGGSKDEIRRGR
jgi:hypothetical protein